MDPSSSSHYQQIWLVPTKNIAIGCISFIQICCSEARSKKLKIVPRHLWKVIEFLTVLSWTLFYFCQYTQGKILRVVTPQYFFIFVHDSPRRFSLVFHCEIIYALQVVNQNYLYYYCYCWNNRLRACSEINLYTSLCFCIHILSLYVIIVHVESLDIGEIKTVTQALYSENI